MNNSKYILSIAFAAILVLSNMGNLFAQSSEIWSQKITILIKAEGTQKYERIIKEDAAAENFDINQYLKENLEGNQIEIYGRFLSETEHISYRFKSTDLPTAIEISTFCEQLVSIEKKPFLGVATTSTEDFEGVNISRVINATAAESVALASGDVIMAVNSESISSGCDLAQAINTFMPGDIVDIEYTRDGQPETIPATLGYRVKKEMTWAPCSDAPASENTFDFEVEETADQNLDIFPNPNEGIFSLQFNSSDLSETRVFISDATGRIIFEKIIKEFDGYYNRSIDISKEASGLYFLNVVQNDKVMTKKIVLQKN